MNNELNKALVSLCEAKKENAGKAATACRMAAEDSVNTFSGTAPHVAEEILKDADATAMASAIALQWIEFWAVEGSAFADGRNELAVDVCRTIKRNHNDLLAQMEDEFDFFGQLWHNASLFVGESPRMHKTLMQQFTSVLLHVLIKNGEKGMELANCMKTERSESWLKLPLI